MGEEGAKTRRSGLEDVARLSGVSIATVDRVMNERGGVSAATALRVIEAAKQLGLRRTLPSPYSRRVRVEVLLVRLQTPFLARLTRAFIQVASTLDRSVIVQRNFSEVLKPQALAQRIRETRADGLILYAEEHPEIIRAIEAVVQAGTPVICLVTDLPDTPRLTYVGIDHAKAGRTAAFISAGLCGRAGSALIVTSNLAYRAHKERVAGFLQGLETHAPGMAVAKVLEGRDDPDRVFELVRQALRREPDVAVIYNTGGFNRSVATAIRNRGKGEGQAGMPVFAGYELTESSVELLREGVMTLTIDQAPELQARRAIDRMLAHLGILQSDGLPVGIPFTLHTLENCDLQMPRA